MKYKALYGTHDILPDESSKWQFLEQQLRRLFGLYTYQALTNNDYAAIQAFIILTTLLYISINWIVDILYGVIDPRVRT